MVISQLYQANTTIMSFWTLLTDIKMLHIIINNYFSINQRVK